MTLNHLHTCSPTGYRTVNAVCLSPRNSAHTSVMGMRLLAQRLGLSVADYVPCTELWHWADPWTQGGRTPCLMEQTRVPNTCAMQHSLASDAAQKQKPCCNLFSAGFKETETIYQLQAVHHV